ncbi:Galactosyl transferase GMA12/MNN10 family protein [Actinidia rufa]|uniref:Galactosyl transferase GMA12/MNN10 family protein n=1 Tax=Actinidia rufa TaxID=165716 RepID=A0A7J0F4U8_9ERIC|nr:Galactosyl transferase GMA12/MNN10 family protein [Actinidia rufa]
MGKPTVQSKSVKVPQKSATLCRRSHSGSHNLLFLWFYTDPWPDLTRTQKPISASDGITGDDCNTPPSSASNLLLDPPNSTFYDDPTLSYSIEEPMQDWDEKRREWLNHQPSFSAGGDDRVLVLTGSQPSPCKNPIGDHLLLRLFKNKVDYCRIHGYDIFYSNSFLHPKMRSYWAKLPLIRAAMVVHPEAEWIWWVDSDAVFTDMEFKLPLRRYKAHNMVVHGWPHLIYEKRSWVGVNAGVFLIRNCQWSMDFMNVWASMGPQSPNFAKWGRIQKSTFPDKMFPASDDQSALVYLLLKEREKWADKIYVEGEYYFQGLRRRYAEKLSGSYAALREPYLKKAGYGKGSWRRPFVTHFTGCQPCNGDHNPLYTGDSCWVGMERTLNFADNQVLRRYGYMRPNLLNSSHVSLLPFDFPAEEEDDDDVETGKISLSVV